MTKCILVIDDEPGIRQVIQVTFKVLTSWETLIAADCPAGIALAESRQPDAILLDVMLPGMDGITAFHRMRENPVTRSIPVILLTAKTGAGERARFAKLPIAGMITKPFTAPELVRQTRSILNWPD
ncbi:response regulator [Pannus brasiliensis CCIBt3594]|uniref:Response regulator n=1 Tax=Pannus brasiliensis CCIBt3594 TaxID=1427578 RepID=A0AAW9QZ69_9CHRO